MRSIEDLYNVDIEVGYGCSLGCTMCNWSDPKFLANYTGYAVMDFNLFKRIVDELAAVHPYPEKVYVAPQLRGEPTLAPKFVEMVEYIKNRNFLCQFNTSGIGLDKEKSERLLASGLTTINFSIDALTEETYKKIRVKSNFEKIMTNIEDFIWLKYKLKSPCNIVVSFVYQPLNAHEMDAFVERWAPVVNMIIIWVLWKDLEQITAGSINGDKKYCNKLGRHLTITADGEVFPCCTMPIDTYLGNIRVKNIMEIVLGEKLSRYVENQERGLMKLNEGCNRCAHWSEYKDLEPPKRLIIGGRQAIVSTKKEGTYINFAS